MHANLFRSRAFFVLSIVALLLGTVQSAQATSPEVGQLSPSGAQRGTTVEFTLGGQRLADAQELMFYAPGFTVEKLEVVDDKQIKATVQVAADCRVGEHAFRVRTLSGVSDLRTLQVGVLPQVAEVEPNNEFTAPQTIEQNFTVLGSLNGEDVDYYVVDAKQGQRLTAVIEGMRLGRVMFDPYVAILDSRRFELSVSDDDALVYQDSIASVVIPADGQYYIQVRESAYRAGGGSDYRLHVGTFPQPRAVIPGGGKLGEEVEVRFLGDVAGEIVQKVKLPDVFDPAFALLAEGEGGISPTGIPFRLSTFGNALEVEPNNDVEHATAMELPNAANGVIGEAGDVDYFRFKATAGAVYDVNCYARRSRTPLDSVMTLSKVGGGQIAANDDNGNPDSGFRVTIPDDGEYVVMVTDHLRKGGPDYAYRVEFTAPERKLTTGLQRVRQFSQERQTIVVPRGNRYAALISARRVDFGGELALSAQDLPAGVTASGENMPDGLEAIPMLFEAAADAPVAGTMATLVGTPVDPNLATPSTFTNNAELIRGPNNTIFWSRDVNRLAVAVTNESPFKLRIEQPRAPLVQNGSMNLKVVAERAEGFTAPITLEMLFNPPGVGSASSVAIAEGQNEALYPLNANGGATVRTWKVAIVGTAPVEGGTVVVSTQLADLEIAPPFVQFTLERAAAEQGQEAKVFCKIQHNTPFEAAAKAQLLGLPNKVVAPELELTSETQEIAFPITIDKESPAGRHQNIVCQVTVMKNGEPVVHTVGATELRIDVPLPPKANEPPPMPVAQAEAPKPAEPEKRLSRLEQLRLEAQQKAAAGG